MNTRINLTGKNSNDIYSVSYPKNLLYFIKYDFNLFMERCVDLCKLYMKTGEYRQEEAAEIRNSISGCHKYFEQNLRGSFEKIVIDCWVEYICRQNEIGVITLWNNYIPCRNEFEKAVFMRLSEYRHGLAINQWVNILKVQEYATMKVDFIFDGKLKGPAEAAARANYFDLMFNVVANELGYDLNTVADNKVYTMGRTPNSPFIMSSVSREIVRNLLADLRYGDDKSKVKKNEAVSDQTAMDAFASMKAFLPRRGDNIVETMIKSLAEVPMKVYMPTSLKAAVDLEIDVIIENQGYLQRCDLCKDYYMRCEEYDHSYCDKLSKGGRSCLEIMAKKGTGIKEKKVITESIEPALLNERCDRLYKEMSSRINIEFTQRDFSDWCRYMNTIRDNVLNGDASLRDFDNFAEYSRSMSFLPNSSTAAKPEEEKKPRIQESKDSKGRTVKPFIFERVDRKNIKKAESKKTEYYDENEEEEDTAVASASRVSSRVIRGVNPETFSTGVTIPYGKDSREQGAVPAQNTKPAARDIPVARDIPAARDVPAAQPERPKREEDVKIYSVKNKEPAKPEEYVKVFSPKKPAKTVSARDIPTAREIPAARNGKESVMTKEANRSLREERPLRTEPQKPRVSAFSQALQSADVPTAREIPTARDIPVAREIPAPAISLNIPKEREERPARIYASQKIEETTEIGFTDILRGFERRDGFSDENIPTDADGVPVSHKTKRVMDAIFKPSKPSLFINVNKGDE